MARLEVTSAIFRPHIILLTTSAISFAFWLFPSFNYLRKGFTKQLPIISIGTLGYISFILLISGAALLGYKAARLTKQRNSRNTNGALESLNNRKLYLIIIALTATGIIYSLHTITRSLDINSLLTAVATGKANDLKYALYEEYSAGIPSLRYLAIYCGAFLLARRLCGINSPLLDITAAILVILASLVSSRLTLVASALGGIYLYIQIKNRIYINLTNFSVYFLIGFLVIAALGWTRNSNFYNDRGLDFFSGSLSEIITYLGTPVQACMYAISNLGEHYDYEIYHNSTTIESSLSTNSALIELTMQYGWFGILYLVGTVFISAALISYIEIKEGGRYFYAAIPLVYSISEIWRTYLFNQGLIITLLSLPIIIITLRKFKNTLNG